jgi:hypothetical protein
MYYELSRFVSQVLLQNLVWKDGKLCRPKDEPHQNAIPEKKEKSIWKDGDLWTAVGGGVAAYFWFREDPAMIANVRQHFGDLLSATSIVFGFALAALLFYIQAAAAWAKDAKVARVAVKIVDWHVWTIICMLFLIGYLLGLWSFGVYLDNSSNLAFGLYALLSFQLLYCGLQILNHTLTVWWSFHIRGRLGSKS